MVSIALPSAEVNGPVIWPWHGAGHPAEARRVGGRLGLVRGGDAGRAGRRPPRPGTRSARRHCDRRFSTCVDSAFAGSHAEAVVLLRARSASPTAARRPPRGSARTPAPAIWSGGPPTRSPSPEENSLPVLPVPFPSCHQYGLRRAPGIIGIKPAKYSPDGHDPRRPRSAAGPACLAKRPRPPIVRRLRHPAQVNFPPKEFSAHKTTNKPPVPMPVILIRLPAQARPVRAGPGRAGIFLSVT